MKHWLLLTLSCLVLLATPFACDLERQAEFPDEAEQLVPASGTVVPEQPVTSEAPAAVSPKTPERSQAKVQQAKTPKKRKVPAAATDNPHGATGEGILGVVVDGGESAAQDAVSAAKHVTDAARPDRAHEAASPMTAADSAAAPEPQQDATAGAGEASAGADDDVTDDGSWF